MNISFVFWNVSILFLFHLIFFILLRLLGCTVVTICFPFQIVIFNMYFWDICCCDVHFRAMGLVYSFTWQHLWQPHSLWVRWILQFMKVSLQLGTAHLSKVLKWVDLQNRWQMLFFFFTTLEVLQITNVSHCNYNAAVQRTCPHLSHWSCSLTPSVWNVRPWQRSYKGADSMKARQALSKVLTFWGENVKNWLAFVVSGCVFVYRKAWEQSWEYSRKELSSSCPILLHNQCTITPHSLEWYCRCKVNIKRCNKSLLYFWMKPWVYWWITALSQYLVKAEMFNHVGLWPSLRLNQL